MRARITKYEEYHKTQHEDQGGSASFVKRKDNLNEIARKLGNYPKLEAKGKVEKIASKVQGKIGRAEMGIEK